MEEAIKVVRKWGAVSVGILSRELGIPPHVASRVIEYLEERGYLVEERCAEACSRCPLGGGCSVRGGRGIKVYRLVEKGAQ